ncbi:MAG: hypothetical protein Q8L89_08715 [Gammaproteobacteria bacterium]|nr:hypothetical protein [Gammaproteobacteria bacterium]
MADAWQFAINLTPALPGICRPAISRCRHACATSRRALTLFQMWLKSLRRKSPLTRSGFSQKKIAGQ